MGLKFVHVDGVDVVDNGGDGDDVDDGDVDAGNTILFTGAPSTAPFCFCRSFFFTSSTSTLLLLLLLPPPVFVLISLLFLLIISNEGMSMSAVSMNGSGIRRPSGFE